jgi:PAS domain-containing protein
MTVRNIQTREGYDIWDKLCAIPRYGFLLAPEGNRVVKAEGIGNWIDQHAAQEVVDQAQSELNELRAVTAELDRLRAEVEALRKDAERYRFIADNACDVIMSASMTDYGDGDTTIGPRVEVDPDQYPTGTFGTAKTKLDAAIDAAITRAAAEIGGGGVSDEQDAQAG